MWLIRLAQLAFVYVLADPIHWSDRAAPLPRPLSAGMGSRVEIPRSDAGPMGQADWRNKLELL
jgi:hypothetical protein